MGLTLLYQQWQPNRLLHGKEKTKPKDSKDADKPHLGPKRKSSGIILDTSPNANKKQKIEDETMSLSKLFEKHLGSTVAAM